jgi:Mg-chelatase subunit ChlD/uncharacterized membrane protein
MTLALLPHGVAIEKPMLLAVLLGTAVAVTLLIARRSWADASAFRRRAAIACRVLLLATLALALSGMSWRRERPEVATIFALDSSDSMRGGLPAAAALAREAARAMQAGDRVGIVQFGRDALVEEPLREDLPEVALASRPASDGSDLVSALRLCRALLPGDGRRRVVVVTDGAVDGADEPSAADPVAALRALRDEGVDVLLVPGGVAASAESLVEEVSAPARAHEGESFEVRAVLRASVATHGRLTLTRDGQLLGQADVDVPADQPVAFRFVERGAAGGTHLYRAHLEAEPDGFEQNDAAEALVRVEGEPSVLLLDPEPARLAALRSLLEGAGLRVDVASTLEAPRTIAEAASHQAIVLSDADSLDFTVKQMDVLTAHVREGGGGLLMTGGPSSFGPGGWYRTPIEDALPVDMDVRNQKYYPSLTFIACIDKSGSMSDGTGATKMDLAKEAVIQAVDLLHEGDRLGVVAFDSAAKWVVDPGPLEDPADAKGRIGTLRAGGGTDIYPALVVAAEAMEASSTMLRHVILLSDGMSPPRDFAAVIGRLKKAGVTLSCVAVGSDADLFTMQSLAQMGGGKYYFTDDPQSIPRVFTKEAFSTARSFVVEERFAPRLVQDHALLHGALPLPDVGGYVACSAKPAAQLLLATHREDPLLAVRRFGLGRTAALTTDLGQRWAASWLQDENGRTLLAQLMRWLSARSDSAQLETRLEEQDGRVRVVVEARDDDGSFLDFADLTASVVGPDLVPVEVTLEQVAPGRYEADVAPGVPGPWMAGVVQHAGDRIVRGTSAARVLPYSQEYRSLEPPADAVARLATLTGARILRDPAEAFARSGPAAQALRPAWRELMLLAALLLLLDVAVRRVMLPEGALARAAAALRRAFVPRGVAQKEAGLASLATAKGRARAKVEAPRPATLASTSAPPSSPPPTSPPAPRAPAVQPPHAPPAQPSDASLTSQLLAAKRRSRKEPRQ